MRVVSLVLIFAACGGKAPGDGARPPSLIDAGIATVAPPDAAPAALAPTPDEARAFVAQVEQDVRPLSVVSNLADWQKETDITPEHVAAAARAAEAEMLYITGAIKASRRYDPIWAELDGDTRRKLTALRILDVTATPDDRAEATELAQVAAQMGATYGETKGCDAAGKCRPLEDLEVVLAKSRKPAELLSAWQAWHDAVGPAIRPMYLRFVPLANAGARSIGFADLGARWRSGYEMTPDAFEAEMERLYAQIEPLYRQLHCYARRELVDMYGKDVVSPTGPIPAHLLGNMWAQRWENLYPELEPYRNVAALDVTPALEKQKWDARRMVELGEAFFVSLGLEPLPPTFWEGSMLEKPDGREVVCHASAEVLDHAADVRIKMCIKPKQADLIVIHHELGHIFYFLAYRAQSLLFQEGAHGGFHEAIGDTIVLSMTPEYMKRVGLLKKVVKSEKAVINEQMRVALGKIAFAPWALLVDRWRWDVFSGKVAPEQYNEHWWALRLRYQGVAPPVARAATDFDPGAKFHIPGNYSYERYFLALVLQFQFHKALCAKAGHKGPLHECSIFGSKPAGDALQAMLALGSSRPWADALELVTGSRQMDAGAMIEYFAPLMTWLEKQNQGQTCGW